MHTYIQNIHIYRYIHIHHMYMHTYIRICKYIVFMYMHICIYTCTYVVCINTYMHMYYDDIYICIYVCMYIQTDCVSTFRNRAPSVWSTVLAPLHVAGDLSQQGSLSIAGDGAVHS